MERDITYSTIDEVCLKMDIYYPLTAGRPVPAVVYIHGGGWYSGDKTTGAGQRDIPALTARGYLVAAIDYRLAPRYKFPAQIEDVKCAIRFLRANAVKCLADSECATRKAGIYWHNVSASIVTNYSSSPSNATHTPYATFYHER
ncbi:alpha/beta hydrolase fold domain-containing protein [Chloroflexota bacterium]